MRTVSILAALVLAATVSAQESTATDDPLAELVRDSPFLAPAGSGPSGSPAAAGDPELRSIVVENGTMYFSIFDPSSQKSEWVRLGDTEGPMVARQYDHDGDALVVEVNGRTLRLSLKEAKVQQTGPAAPAPPPNALPSPGPMPRDRQDAPVPGGPPPTNQGLGGTGGPTPVMNPQEAERLQNLANEIRRRRGMREAAPNQTPPKQ